MLKREAGFTLIELIAVMIILGVITTAAVVRYGDFGGSATQKVIDLAISELNTREKLTWSNVKLSDVNGDDAVEAAIIAIIDWDIGNGTVVNETSINVRGHTASVKREPAKHNTPAIWSRN